MTAYYNEIDPSAAQWLRNLIDAGHIAPGYVDERSIEDVYPSDLRGFTQCHFFAGIGVWSYALRQAGWSDDRPVWTGSCPCQPFSAAGKGTGFDDERHLWPAFHHLIKECKPATVFGEQVASKDADAWIDLVHTDLEALGYAFGAVPFPSAGIGAPHIRDRAYWVADYASIGRERRRAGVAGDGGGETRVELERLRDAYGLADANYTRSQGRCRVRECASERIARSGVVADGLEHAGSIGRNGRETPAPGYDDDRAAPERAQGEHGPGVASAHRIHQHGAGPTNGFWRDADWLLCRDGKWRPVEPGTFPLAHGASSRVVRLRAYGNAINAKAAQVFIEGVMDGLAKPQQPQTADLFEEVEA